VLERAGWTFWRCFASTWSLRQEEVLAELLQRLAAMGIEPLGKLEKIPSLVEYREWHPKSVDQEAEADFVGQELESAIRASNQDVAA